jgi:hypothetical protein
MADCCENKFDPGQWESKKSRQGNLSSRILQLRQHTFSQSVSRAGILLQFTVSRMPRQVRVTPAVTDFLCDAIALLNRPSPAAPPTPQGGPPTRPLPSPPRLATSGSSLAGVWGAPQVALPSPPAHTTASLPRTAAASIAGQRGQAAGPSQLPTSTGAAHGGNGGGGGGGGLETGAWVLSGRLPRLDLRVLSTRPGSSRPDYPGSGTLQEASVLLVLSELAVLYMPGGGDARPVVVSTAPNGAGNAGIDKSGLSQRLTVSLRSVELHLVHPAAPTGVGSAAGAAAGHDNFARVDGIRGSLLVRNAAPPQAKQPLSPSGLEPVAGVGDVGSAGGSAGSCGGAAAATALVLVGRAEARANLRSQQVVRELHCRFDITDHNTRLCLFLLTSYSHPHPVSCVHTALLTTGWEKHNCW